MKNEFTFTSFIITAHGRSTLEVINEEILETTEYVKSMTGRNMPFNLCFAEISADEHEDEHMPTGYLCDSQTSQHESNLFNLTDKSKLVQNENIKKYGRKQDQKPKYGKMGRPKREERKNVQ